MERLFEIVGCIDDGNFYKRKLTEELEYLKEKYKDKEVIPAVILDGKRLPIFVLKEDVFKFLEGQVSKVGTVTEEDKKRATMVLKRFIEEWE